MLSPMTVLPNVSGQISDKLPPGKTWTSPYCTSQVGGGGGPMPSVKMPNTVHIQLEVSPNADNKTASLIDLENSTIVP